MKNYGGLFMILMIIVAAVFVKYMDNQDWYCPRIFGNPEGVCDWTNGMPYRNSTPEEGDSASQLLDRIESAAGAERKSIKWRKSFFLAVVIAVLVYALVITPGRLPCDRWPEFYTCIIIGFSVLYFHFNWYSYHRFNVPEENINKALDMLREKLA